MAQAAISALAKLDQLLPPTLRRQVGALDAMTSRLGGSTSPVDAELLVTLTRACRDGERLRVGYRDGRGRETERTIDPHRLVQTPRRWYLVARDRDRDDWRTFRVDRLIDVVATGHIVRLVDPPDPVAFVQESITLAPYRHQARVELLAPIEDVRPLVPATSGALEPIDDRAHDADDRRRRPPPARVPPRRARRRLRRPRADRAPRRDRAASAGCCVAAAAR